MEKTAYFKHALTGLVGKYPENYGALFPDVFERVESKDYNCVDCGPKEAPTPNFEAEFGTPIEVQDNEPAPNFDDDENEAE